ncbi:hypothetical protein FJZ48_03505 [Candidatus Uhrbacteria bacterium]|nr:hypothetical protein [Candidatus Uhrbacteria bacterium]
MLTEVHIAFLQDLIERSTSDSWKKKKEQEVASELRELIDAMRGGRVRAPGPLLQEYRARLANIVTHPSQQELGEKTPLEQQQFARSVERFLDRTGGVRRQYIQMASSTDVPPDVKSLPSHAEETCLSFVRIDRRLLGGRRLIQEGRLTDQTWLGRFLRWKESTRSYLSD